MFFRIVVVFTTFVSSFCMIVDCQDTINIVFVIEPEQEDIPHTIANTLKELDDAPAKIKISNQYVVLKRKVLNESMDNLCSLFYNGISIVLDLTYFEWEEGVDLIKSTNVIYFKIDASIGNFLSAMEKLIVERDGNDAVMIFQNNRELQEGLYYLIQKSNLRVLPINGITSDVKNRIDTLRPLPGYYAVFANTLNMKTIYQRISSSKYFNRADKWHFFFLDFNFNDFDRKTWPDNITLAVPNNKYFCSLLKQPIGCKPPAISSFIGIILKEMLQQIQEFSRFESISQRKFNCDGNDSNELVEIKNYAKLSEIIEANKFLKLEESTISYYLNLSILRTGNESEVEIAQWNSGELITSMDSLKPAKRFFRIGTTEAIPWSYLVRDPLTKETVLDSNGNPIWEGYCVDLIAKLAEKMSFDYEIVPPRIGTFGRRLKNGSWDGLVGDLMVAETDIAVAALKMTAEREEVIDFIAPYFENTGISIVIRRPYRHTSLFKFMTVLRLEVWLSIIGALVATAVMIWFLDKYSPYSAQNCKHVYNYPCREFTMKESFWFALTSLTPQGGGEVPKSLSARTLVAAYWLFVVLMLATFTANLAAFLTVERMQTPVQSLEQLARQSRINYTVVANSDTHKHFINMKFAEDTLYRLWKELTLNATSDQSQYRIWDYPIKEQYGNILLAINSSNPVKDAEEGFRKVSEHENADFAFIHDSAEIKYEISRNCNLTEVGDVFAEQPYAIAIPQGSNIQDEISFAVLELQKERFLDELTAKYWNSTGKKDCANSDDSEGITLESLGGVFIATLFGLGLAMVTLVIEVIYYKRKDFKLTKVQPIGLERHHETNSKMELVTSSESSLPPYTKNDLKTSYLGEQITLSKEFVPTRRRVGGISYIDSRKPIHGEYYYE